MFLEKWDGKGTSADADANIPYMCCVHCVSFTSTSLRRWRREEKKRPFLASWLAVVNLDLFSSIYPWCGEGGGSVYRPLNARYMGGTGTLAGRATMPGGTKANTRRRRRNKRPFLVFWGEQRSLHMFLSGGCHPTWTWSMRLWRSTFRPVCFRIWMWLLAFYIALCNFSNLRSSSRPASWAGSPAPRGACDETEGFGHIYLRTIIL